MPSYTPVSDQFLDWINQVLTKNPRPNSCSITLDCEGGETVVLRPFTNAARTVALRIEVDVFQMVGSTTVAGGFLLDPSANKWIGILSTGPHLGALKIAEALSEMLLTNFDVNLNSVVIADKKLKFSAESLPTKLLETIPSHITLQLEDGLPNLFLRDPKLEATEGLIASLSGYMDFSESHASFYASLAQRLDRLAQYPTLSMDESDHHLIISLENGSYIQIEQIPNRHLLYADSQSRAYKEKEDIEVSEFHEAAAMALGWQTHQLVPNEFGLYESRGGLSLGALALHIIRSLVVLHNWDGLSPVTMQLERDGSSWREITVFYPYGPASSDEDDGMFEDNDE